MNATMTRDLVDLSREARQYPAYLLAGAETGLCLFSAAFLGVNDAIHFARKRIVTTCVDVDGDKLEQMQAIYPPGWEFVEGDAFVVAELAAAGGRQWDAVSVDPFLGDAENRVRRNLETFLALARDVITITIPRTLRIPEVAGWTASTFPRSRSAAWLVMRRV